MDCGKAEDMRCKDVVVKNGGETLGSGPNWTIFDDGQKQPDDWSGHGIFLKAPSGSRKKKKREKKNG